MVCLFSIVFISVILSSAFLQATASPPGKVLEVMEGDGFQIQCYISHNGISDTDVTFFKDGQPVLPSFRITIKGGTLKVILVQMSDSGVYSCQLPFDVDRKQVGMVIVRPLDLTQVPEIVGSAVVILVAGIMICKKCCASQVTELCQAKVRTLFAVNSK